VGVEVSSNSKFTGSSVRFGVHRLGEDKKSPN